MKIFVISLLNSKERRKSIISQLERLKLDFEIVDAVEGKKLTSENIRQYCDAKALENNPRWLNLSAVGCALSHKAAYERIIEQGLSGALILEDDTLLPNELSLLLNEVEQKASTNEVTLFYYRGHGKLYFSKKNTRNVGKYQMLYPINEESFPLSAVGYYITNAACRSLMNVVLPIRVTADSWRYFYENKGIDKISIVFPRPINHANFKSEIDYVGSYESKFRSIISRRINEFKVPILYEILKKRRLEIEKNMSDFVLVDEDPCFKNESNEDE